MDKHHFSSEENAEAYGITVFTHIVTHVSINIYKLTLNLLIIGQFYPYIQVEAHIVVSRRS